MINAISQGAETLIITASTTFGYGANQTAPPRLLLCSASTGINVVLPTIPPVLPTAPGTPGTAPGTGDGLLITIRNMVNQNVTVVAGGSDTIFDNLFLNTTGAEENLCAQEGTTTWYRLVNPFGACAYRAVGSSTTVTTGDRFVNTTTAGTVTLLAVGNYPIGTEVITIVNSSSGSDTISPASTASTIDGQTAWTLTTKTGLGLLTDGTNWFVTHSV
jgi:hypothetical protein